MKIESQTPYIEKIKGSEISAVFALLKKEILRLAAVVGSRKGKGCCTIRTPQIRTSSSLPSI